MRGGVACWTAASGLGPVFPARLGVRHAWGSGLLDSCIRSGSRLSSLRAWWRKLLRFSLHFVGSDILLCMGWSFSRLNLADCVRILVSLVCFQAVLSPVGVPITWTGVDLRAPVMMILQAWFCILVAFGSLKLVAFVVCVCRKS